MDAMRGMLVFMLAWMLSCSSGGGGGGGGAGGSTGSCSAACSNIAKAQCPQSATDCPNSCEKSRQEFTQQGCGSAFASYLECASTAPTTCSADGFSTQPSCDGASQSVIDCSRCGPDTGPKPGDPCSAADEGKSQCWGCKGIIDCRYGDSVFLWRVKEDCQADGTDYECVFDPEFDTEPYCGFAM